MCGRMNHCIQGVIGDGDGGEGGGHGGKGKAEAARAAAAHGGQRGALPPNPFLHDFLVL